MTDKDISGKDFVEAAPMKRGWTTTFSGPRWRLQFFQLKFVRGLLWTVVFMALFISITGAWKLNLYLPLRYWGDALDMLSYLGRDYVFNDLRQRFFAPYGIEHVSSWRYLYNFLFQPNSTLFLVAYSITRDTVASMNLYYLSTFPLIFVSAYWVYGRLKLANPFRFGASALYALMPFHFLRGVGHLLESSYFLVPILAYVTILTFRAKPYFHAYINDRWQWSWTEKRDWFFLFAMVFLSSINEYHQFFFILLLPIAAIASSMRHQNYRILTGATILLAGAGIGIVSKICMGNLLNEPGLRLSQIGMPISGYGQEERYGLKMVQVLLPVVGDPISFFRQITTTYDGAHEINENSTVALGLFGAVGFVSLLVRATYAIIKKGTQGRIIGICSFLTVCCVLIGTVGGGASVIATIGDLLLGPDSLLAQVRCYNRIIVFIAFFSYYASSLLLVRITSRVAACVRDSSAKRALTGMIWLPVFAFALWDQAPVELTNPADAIGRYRSDEKFFPRMETELTPDALIFQYPFNIHHTEASGPTHYPYNYSDGMRPYLNSKRLRFTYGGDNNSVQITWLEETSRLPITQMLDRLCMYRFSGIVVHRKLFDSPQSAAAFEKALTAVLGSPLQTSDDGDFSFAPIDEFCAASHIPKLDLAAERGRLLADEGPIDNIDFSKRSYPGFVTKVSGLSWAERFGRWTDGPSATIHFKKALPRKFILNITANAFGPNNGVPVKVRVGEIEKTFVITRNTGETYRLEFSNNDAAKTVEIIPPKPTSPKEINSKSGDTRRIGIALISLKIEG